MNNFELWDYARTLGVDGLAAVEIFEQTFELKGPYSLEQREIGLVNLTTHNGKEISLELQGPIKHESNSRTTC